MKWEKTAVSYQTLSCLPANRHICVSYLLQLGDLIPMMQVLCQALGHPSSFTPHIHLPPSPACRQACMIASLLPSSDMLVVFASVLNLHRDSSWSSLWAAWRAHQRVCWWVLGGVHGSSSVNHCDLLYIGFCIFSCFVFIIIAWVRSACSHYIYGSLRRLWEIILISLNIKLKKCVWYIKLCTIWWIVFIIAMITSFSLYVPFLLCFVVVFFSHTSVVLW